MMIEHMSIQKIKRNDERLDDDEDENFPLNDMSN